MSQLDSAHGGLTGLRVIKNCPAHWHRMEGDYQVRFCTHCSKNVYNLSGMDRQSAEDLINQTEGKICVRYYARPDGTVMTADCPKAQVRKVKLLAAVGGVLSALGIALGFPVFAQAAIASPETAVRSELRAIKEIGDELKDAKDPKERAELFALQDDYKQRLRKSVAEIRERDK